MARRPTTTGLAMPALRGRFGDWVFYSCLMPLCEIGARVDYASVLHPAQAHELSRMIQRALEGRRAEEIADYIENNAERFFNALVLATYGQRPDWIEIGVERSRTRRVDLAEISDEALKGIGFLRLSGRERIFAVDGQHRLSGIKAALQRGGAIGAEAVPVIFVGHENTARGMRRTRRLFTTLNKTAVAVRKRDIIALDEDDVMAIVARELYETDPRFNGPRLSIVSTNNLPAQSGALTTIGNLYDVLKIVFMHEAGVSRDTTLRFNRPSDQRLASYRARADSFFAAIAANFPAVAEYFDADEPEVVARSFRSPVRGGHLLFRPIGLEILTRACTGLAAARACTIEEAVAVASVLPMRLDQAPFRDVIWNPETSRMMVGNKTLARRLVFHMLGLAGDEERLRTDYAAALEDVHAALPPSLA